MKKLHVISFTVLAALGAAGVRAMATKATR